MPRSQSADHTLDVRGATRRSLRLAQAPPVHVHALSPLLARLPKVTLRERAAGPAFQVLLEANGHVFGRELDDDDWCPGAVEHGVTTRSVIVPVQSPLEVGRGPDIVTTGIAATPEDVHETPTDTAHAFTGRKAVAESRKRLGAGDH
jgi:hypothetical protein